MVSERTIGGSGDHADINSWVAWVSDNMVVDGLLTDDVVGYVQSTEFEVNVVQTITGWEMGGVVSGFTTTLTVAPGESFIDNPAVRTNPLCYDGANGAAVHTKHTAPTPVISVEVANCTISRLQLAKKSNAQPIISAPSDVSGVDNLLVDSCIVFHDFGNGNGIDMGTGVGGGVQNCLILLASSSGFGIKVSAAGGFAVNNTVVNLNFLGDMPGLTGNGIVIGDDNETTLTDNAIIGFTNDVYGNGNVGGSNNATDLDGTIMTSAGTVNSLTSNQVNVVATTEFVGATASGTLGELTGLDFRVSPTSVKLKNNGTSVGVPSVDISGTNRSPTPTIGAWEADPDVSAPPVPPGAIFFAP